MCEICWRSCTVVQIVLCLILIVALPFLAGMITLYCLSSFAWTEYVFCPEICHNLVTYPPPDYIDSTPVPVNSSQTSMDDYNATEISSSTRKNGSQETLDHLVIDDMHKDYKKFPNEELMKKRGCYLPTNLVKYPFLAAIVETMYQDDFDIAMFRCMAVILSEDYVICASRCLYAQNESFPELYIRSGSNHFARRGIAHYIHKRVPVPGNDENFPTFTLIEVTPKFPDLPDIVEFIPIAKPGTKSLKSFGWSAHEFIALDIRRQNVAPKEFKMPSVQCRGNITDALCFALPEQHQKDEKIRGFIPGAPLISDKEELVGIHVISYDYGEFEKNIEVYFKDVTIFAEAIKAVL